MRKNPKIILGHEFFDMSREEQIKAGWLSRIEAYKADRDSFFANFKSVSNNID